MNESNEDKKHEMRNSYNGEPAKYSKPDVMSFVELWEVIWGGKWLLISITFLVGISSIAYSLSLSNKYTSHSLLSPVEQKSNGGGKLANLAGKLGGIAGLAGISLGGDDKTELALATLKSREFLTTFIKNHDILIPLMAAEDWDRDSGQLIIDPNIYDEINGVWVRDVAPPLRSQPTLLEAYEVLLEKIGVNEIKKSGFINLSVQFYSPEIAKEWLEKLIVDLNSKIRDLEVEEADKSIVFLKTQVQETDVTQMHQVLYDLIEQQTQIIMLANIRREYVFKTVDKPFVPEEKSSPVRSLIVVLSTFSGGVLALLILLVRNKFK